MTPWKCQTKLPCLWLFTRIVNPAPAQALWTSHCSISLRILTVSWPTSTQWGNSACSLMSRYGLGTTPSHATGNICAFHSYIVMASGLVNLTICHWQILCLFFGRAVLAACSCYFEAMFSGGLRESLDRDVNFRDSIHPEVLLLLLQLHCVFSVEIQDSVCYNVKLHQKPEWRHSQGVVSMCFL